MLKSLIIVVLILGLLGFGGALVLVAPYHIYTLTLTEGVTTTFLKMNPSPSQFYDGHPLYFYPNPNSSNEEGIYSIFHFSNYEIPFPLNNSLFSFIPVIRPESGGHRLGGNFYDGKRVELFSFMVDRIEKLDTSYGDQKLFLLPVFKNHISRKSDHELWEDLFSKKLSLPSNIGNSFLDTLLSLKSVTYNDLVYNLFVLYNRNHLFPKDTVKITYDKNLDLGVLELQSEDPNIKKEKIYILQNGLIYPITIKTRKKILSAESYRNTFLSRIKFKLSNKDSAIPIYAEYKNIPYVKRIDQQGMTYLFCAWSHDIENRDYIRVIIYFLERGKSNLKFLKPFYEYAYKKFGTNLSSDAVELLETAEEKLKRKSADELESEIKIEEKKLNTKFEGEMSNPEEKVKSMLQKAKDNKINTDEDGKTLYQD